MQFKLPNVEVVGPNEKGFWACALALNIFVAAGAVVVPNVDGCVNDVPVLPKNDGGLLRAELVWVVKPNAGAAVATGAAIDFWPKTPPIP